jgi:hypothetical protein
MHQLFFVHIHHVGLHLLCECLSKHVHTRTHARARTCAHTHTHTHTHTLFQGRKSTLVNIQRDLSIITLELKLIKYNHCLLEAMNMFQLRTFWKKNGFRGRRVHIPRKKSTHSKMVRLTRFYFQQH